MKMEISFDEPLNVDWDGNELLLSDILGTEDDIIYKDMEVEVEKKLLKRAIDKLSSRERNIIDALWSDTRGQRVYTKRSGRSDEYFPVLYFASGKKDHEASEKGNYPL